MILFEWILALLLTAVVLTSVADRIKVPYPSLLAIAGAGLAFLPFAPDIQIESDFAMALFVAPALLDAAFDTSPRDLKRNAAALTSLAVVAVVLTTAVVAVVGWRLAGLPIAAAVALGAIVAPPDAAAAAAVLAKLNIPRRLMLLLQGESLLNDATALLIYRAAVTAAVGTFSITHHAPLMLLSAAGSLVAGYALARLYIVATSRIRDAASSTVLQFVGTFGVWLLAERLTLSPIITVVIYAMTLAQTVARRTEARQRISSYSVWETAIFVLNVLAFVLMGLQARHILERLSGAERTQALLIGLSVLAAVIVIRIVWVAVYRITLRLVASKPPPGNVRSVFLVSWTGMRGLVTLATAFALPAEFPGRDLIVLCAFCVVLGTLVIQGLTLNPLLRLLRLEDDGSLERETSEVRVAVMQAALDSLAGDTSPAAAAVREQYAAARKVAEDKCDPRAATEHDRLRLHAIAAQREALHRLRTQGSIGDEAFRRIQEELDWAELDAAPAGSFQSLTT